MPFIGFQREPGNSFMTTLARLPTKKRVQVVSDLPEPVRRDMLKRPWWYVARVEQEPPPGEWSIWLIMSGRGWGKSRTGSETLLQWVLELPTWEDIPTEWAIFAETKADARVICVLGPSGIIRAMERLGMVEDTDYDYNRSLGVITLLAESPRDDCRGQIIHVQGADDADVGRGLNLCGAWLDEYAKWKYAAASWIEGIMPSLRIGPHPRVIVTTTPKPIAMLREWTKRRDGSVHVTRGSTFENRNLSQLAKDELRKRYEGTRMGRQELHGELLTDVEGALWNRAQIDADRLLTVPSGVEIIRTVIGVDPAVTSGEEADETGIVAAGKGNDGRGYILGDHSMRDTPAKWAQRIVDAYKFHDANAVVIEVNNGGEALAALIHTIDATIPCVEVHAKKAKRVRAEPVSALYEQHRISHLGKMDALEDQICVWTPEEVESPDRMDALVYAVLALFESNAGEAFAQSLTQQMECSVCHMPYINGRPFCGH